MKRISLLAATAALVVAASPAFAKSDCAEGFKTHMKKLSIYTDNVSGDDLVAAVRKSLDAHSACNAGDSLTQYGVWDDIIAEMKAKAGN